MSCKSRSQTGTLCILAHRREEIGNIISFSIVFLIIVNLRVMYGSRNKYNKSKYEYIFIQLFCNDLLPSSYLYLDITI